MVGMVGIRTLAGSPREAAERWAEEIDWDNVYEVFKEPQTLCVRMGGSNKVQEFEVTREDRPHYVAKEIKQKGGG